MVMKVRVLVVDDSRVVRQMLSKGLASDPGIEVLGTAADPLEASEKIESLKPDVITLDLEMPKMDGLTFLNGLMKHHPLPVIIVSAFTPKGSKLAMDALEAGAVDIIPKPSRGYSLRDMTGELAAKIKAAARAKVKGYATLREHQPSLQQIPNHVLTQKFIVIGGSTGATQALQLIFSRLSASMPGIVVVQHMPAGFTKTFADRLNSISELQIKEAEQNDTVQPGHVLIAPGNFHMTVNHAGSRYFVDIKDGPRVSRQRPAADVLFHSAAQHFGKRAIGVILTGMGADGAEGMVAMKQSGAINIAQDEQSCVVFGMPREAIKLGCVDHVVGLEQIPAMLHRLLR